MTANAERLFELLALAGENSTTHADLFEDELDAYVGWPNDPGGYGIVWEMNDEDVAAFLAMVRPLISRHTQLAMSPNKPQSATASFMDETGTRWYSLDEVQALLVADGESDTGRVTLMMSGIPRTAS